MDETKSPQRKTPEGWDHNGPGSSNMRETCARLAQSLGVLSLSESDD